MSWLYEHRDQLDGFKLLVEIAHQISSRIPPPDREDVEQKIVIMLISVSERRGQLGSGYLAGIARNLVRQYWRKRYYHQKFFRPLRESDDGEIVVGEWKTKLISDDGDDDARLDAQAVLATLPKRLVEIGYKRVNGERLNDADRHYWVRHHPKAQYGSRVSEEEKGRMVQLYLQRVPVYQIAKAMGRSRGAVDFTLAKAGMKEPQDYLSYYRKHRKPSKE